MEPYCKSIFKSRTLWFNVLSLLAVILSTIAGWSEVKDYAPYLLSVVNLINIVLRMITTKPIGSTKPTPSIKKADDLL